MGERRVLASVLHTGDGAVVASAARIRRRSRGADQIGHLDPLANRATGFRKSAAWAESPSL